MIKKIFIAIFLLIAITVGGTGCMRTNQLTLHDSKPNANELALAYMEEKYGETFTYLAPWGNSMSGTREILVTCDSLPGQQILVQVENFKTEQKIYRDNYHAVKYQDEVIDFFKTTAADTFGAVNVFYTPSKIGVSTDLPADASFDAYYSDAATVLPVTIEIAGSRFTDSSAIENYLYSISQTQGHISISFIVVQDDIFGTLDENGLFDLVTQKNEVYSTLGTILNGTVQVD